MRFVPGERLGRWEMVSELGRGGNGQVWLARADDGSEAAIKILTEWRPQEERFQRFQNEVSVHQRIGRRPGVVPMLDFGFPEVARRGEYPWLTMPVAVPLRQHLGTTPPLSAVIESVAPIAEALADLQTLNVAHRDIKPENLYWLDGAAAIGDFGLAKFPEQIPLTDDGRSVGPRNYLAPEMVNNPSTADPFPADVWLLAKTLWVLASGQTWPPQGEIRAGAPYVRLRELTTDSRAFLLEPLLERSTQFVPTDRPSMSEFARELGRWLAGPSKALAATGFSDLAEQLNAAVAPAARVQELQDGWRAVLRLHMDRLEKGVEEVRRALGERGLTRFGVDSGGALHPFYPLMELLTGPPRRIGLHGYAHGFLVRIPVDHGQELRLSVDAMANIFDDGLLHMMVGYVLTVGVPTPSWTVIGKPQLVWSDEARETADSVAAELRAADLANRLVTHLRDALQAAIERRGA